MAIDISRCDNPFNDQTAFSPPQRGLHSHYGDRERTMSQPNLERGFAGEYQAAFPRDGLVMHPEGQMSQTSNLRLAIEKLNDDTELPALLKPGNIADPRQFHSAPVTPYETPVGSRQGSPKTPRKSKLLGAFFGAGVYGRQCSEEVRRGHLSYLTEDNEDDATPFGSPADYQMNPYEVKGQPLDLEQLRIGDSEALLRHDTSFLASQLNSALHGEKDAKDPKNKYREFAFFSPM